MNKKRPIALLLSVFMILSSVMQFGGQSVVFAAKLGDGPELATKNLEADDAAKGLADGELAEDPDEILLSEKIYGADTGTDSMTDWVYNKNEENKTAEITAFNNINETDTAVIPEYFEEENIRYKVTGIGANAFCLDINKTVLKRIVVPATVTTIGYGAFHNCEKLEYLTIPGSVTRIGDFDKDNQSLG